MNETSLALALSSLSFMMAVIWGGPLIRVLRHFKIGKMIRVEGPDRHITKMGTPTMGGVMVIAPVFILTLLLNFATLLGLNVLGRSVLLPLIAMLLFGILGAIDDWEGIRGPRRGLGLPGRVKFIIEIFFAVGIGFILKYVFHAPEMHWPGFEDPFSLDIFYVPVAAFIILATSNSINLTDGLDSLAGLISVTAFLAYGGIALLQGELFVGRFCFTVVGGLFGFLWFNSHPAELFMGDTGSLAIGAALGVVSLMTGQWLLLPLIAVIPVSETLSVILQVGYFKWSGGKRLFKMSPLHHHFELSGWSETQVVQRFWLVNLLFAMLGIALAMIA